jgi:phage baseplate assembly protein W
MGIHMTATNIRNKNLHELYKKQLMDVITTRIGSRLMNRHYGSTLHLFQDKPINEYYKSQLKVAILNAISTLSNAFRVIKIDILYDATKDGVSHLSADIIVNYLPTNDLLEIEQLNISSF